MRTSGRLLNTIVRINEHVKAAMLESNSLGTTIAGLVFAVAFAFIDFCPFTFDVTSLGAICVGCYIFGDMLSAFCTDPFDRAFAIVLIRLLGLCCLGRFRVIFARLGVLAINVVDRLRRSTVVVSRFFSQSPRLCLISLSLIHTLHTFFTAWSFVVPYFVLAAPSRMTLTPSTKCMMRLHETAHD